MNHFKNSSSLFILYLIDDLYASSLEAGVYLCRRRFRFAASGKEEHNG